jgi:ubiquitin carboxyl-terminal hydrolase L5
MESSKTATAEDDVYHFISYIPVNGKLYELDGLKSGPIYLGDCNNENWIENIFPIIQKRIERYSKSEIRFNLMALIKSRKKLIEEKLFLIESKKKTIVETLNPSEEEATNLKQQLEVLANEEQNLLHQLQFEKDKQENWKIENIRRRHNYIPFLINLLKLLAEKGQLADLVEKAKRKKS